VAANGFLPFYSANVSGDLGSPVDAFALRPEHLIGTVTDHIVALAACSQSPYALILSS
jgi:hypothetical protein